MCILFYETLPTAFREALRIKNTILRQLVPKLQTAISAKSPYDHVHKVNRNIDFAVEREQEAREVLRVPIALAIVKLLQKLPGDALKQNLTGVLLKVCVFLRSKIESTRRAARETMLEVLLVLGSKYLHKILTELCALLTRGYQMHVLIFTVHALIVGVANIIQPGDIDPCLTNILQVN
jgi:U3 small nucleolar RNA-associated protein 20